MANKEHLAILEQGVEAWNEWRQENHKIQPDLSGASFFGAILRGTNLNGANLGRVNFSRANLSYANLIDANLIGAYLIDANLSYAILIDADLSRANLSRADFSRAKLFGAILVGVILIDTDFIDADFSRANLSRANLDGVNLNGVELGRTDLSGANLTRANFSYAFLQDANFSKAYLGRTVFADNDLSIARGLESVKHRGPSTIGVDTLYKSGGNIPEAFLRGCGLKDWEIEAAKLYRSDLTPGQASEILYKVHELRTNPAIQFHSCFLSYSSKNHSFAEQLYADLQNKGVRCWFAPEDLKIGEKIRVGIDESIRMHDKLLLVLSKHSVESEWVEKEIETAMERERRQKRIMLFPIMLDNSVLKIESGWPADIRRSRNIGDFRKWKDHDSYQKAFNRLLRDLKAEESK